MKETAMQLDQLEVAETRADRFNATGFSRWINGSSGRAFRFVAGVAWLAFAVAFRGHWWGIAAGLFGLLPLSAGIFDLCWVSAALGGPLRGETIRRNAALRRR
jgi:hypothetical protein